MKSIPIPGDLQECTRAITDAFVDNRRGPNLCYAMSEAVLSYYFILQSPPFAAFQQKIQDRQTRSNCQTLFGKQCIPSDGLLRNTRASITLLIRPLLSPKSLKFRIADLSHCEGRYLH